MASQDLKKLHDKIMKEFSKCFEEALNSDACFKFFVKLMQQSVEEAVYDKYTPIDYERRRDTPGKRGLQDPSRNNYEYVVKVKGFTALIFMKNLAQSANNETRAFQIDEGIVTGKDEAGNSFYDYGPLSKGIYPRDFYEHMLTLIDKESERRELHSILKKEINKKSKTIKL